MKFIYCHTGLDDFFVDDFELDCLYKFLSTASRQKLF